MSDVLSPLTRRVHTGYCWRVKPGEHPTRIDRALDDARIGRHLQGPDRYGVCPLSPGSSGVKLALIDLDSHKGETSWPVMCETALAVMEAARDQGLRAIPFRSSGGRGIHLYFLWNEFQDAFSVRQALRAVLAQCNLLDGTKGVAAGFAEIFPKQNELADGAYGSMFILPLAGGSRSCPLKGLE